MQLGSLGVWFFPDLLSGPLAADFAKRIEALGYSALWIPEATGKHPFASAAFMLAQTTRLIVATGIANIYARDPMTMSAGAKTLAEQSGGRFVLGIGVSHRPLVEGLRGHKYESPIRAMRAYLEKMEKSPYTAVPPAEPVPVVLAALGPQMLKLAATRAQGAHPYFTTPAHTELARKLMGKAAWLCVEQKVLLESDPLKARAAARATAAMYLALENYRNNWKRIGFQDSDFESGGSDRFIDETFAWGDLARIRKRVQAHLDAGASHVCVQPVNPEGLPLPDWKVLEGLAPKAAS